MEVKTFKKKDKFYLLIFILSCLSILISIILKSLGIDWFSLYFKNIFIPIKLEYVINTIMLMIQFYLIVGCITRYEPKKLFIKLLPYFPLNILIYFFPGKFHFALCLIIMFSVCLSLRPKFSTLISFIINLLLIFSMQFILLWLKLDIKNFLPVFPNVINILLINIDQFILLGFLYFVNRKWGEKYAKLVLHRRKR